MFPQILVCRSVYPVIARTLSEAEGDVAIPWLEGKTIENRPKIHGIATPVCALVRNDRSIKGALNGNLFFLLFLPEGLIKEHQADHHGDATAGNEAICHIEHGKIDEFRGDHIHHEA